MLKDNQKKVGIYRWINKVNGKTYIGSSVNISIRFRGYYNFSFLSLALAKSKSLIYSAILKYGYSNFQLEILEFCSIENAISKEQYYIDLFKPEYNILTTAGSRLGRLHSKESKLKMSKSAQGRKLSEETKILMSLIMKGMKNPNFGKPLTEAWIALAKIKKPALSESMKAKMSVDSGTALKVVDLKTQETSVYPSIKKAAKAIGVSHPAISKRLSKIKDSSFIVVKKRFQVEKVNVPGNCPSNGFRTMSTTCSKSGGSPTLSKVRGVSTC
jgi:group I intron endonuclease